MNVSGNWSFVGLKSTAEGKNFQRSSNCIFWDGNGIHKNGELISDKKIREGRVGISIKMNGQMMLVQFTREKEDKVYEAMEFYASYPIYLMGWASSDLYATTEILKP